MTLYIEKEGYEIDDYLMAALKAHGIRVPEDAKYILFGSDTETATTAVSVELLKKEVKK